MQDIKYRLARLSIAEKIIVINLLLFVLPAIFNSLVYLLELGPFSFLAWMELSSDLSRFIVTPWTLVTYGFFHAGFGHLFWNMVVLYFSGRIFLNVFDSRRFINVYFLGIIAGGLIFIASYNIFPVFKSYPPLIGASAGVTAVLIFICAYMPNTVVRLIFFNVKLWYIGAFFVIKDIITIPVSGNEGGNLAHLGGAALGFFLARQLLEGKDKGEWFSKLIDSFSGARSRSPLKTVHKKKPKAKSTVTRSDVGKKRANQQKIDAILDKISKSGYESLTKQEKDFLFKSGKDN